MKKELTEVVFILDKSGSMAGLEKDTIGGFNSTIQKQKEGKGEVIISTVLFDTYTKVIHDRVKIEEVKEMTKNDYYPSGCTALLDAIGGAIKHIKNVHKYIREEDVPEKTLFIITTDGMENSSHQYTYQKVKNMIEKMKNEYKWEFIFMGANIDAIHTASRFGLDEEYAVNYIADEIGTKTNYDAINKAIYSVRECKELNASWKEDIEEDYKKRNK